MIQCYNNFSLTYCATGVGKVDSKLSHGTDDGHQTLDCVAVDDRPVLLALILRVACFVYYLHLLNNCALSRLSSTCKILKQQ